MARLDGTTAQHPASDKSPAGKVELGSTVADVEAFYRDTSAKFGRRTLQRRRGGCLGSHHIRRLSEIGKD